MRVFLSAAEASGDVLGAGLVKALRSEVGRLDAFGLAGERMRSAGVEGWHDTARTGVNGLIEAVRHVPRLLGLARTLARRAVRRSPEVAVLIDAPDFNIWIARSLYAAGIPVVFYGAPTVWAWRAGRAQAYARWVRRMLVLFPFELAPWRDVNVQAECVGHPLVDILPRPAPLEDIEPGTFAMLPGSRVSELRRHLPVLLDAVGRLRGEGRLRRILLPVAAGLDVDDIHRLVRTAGLASMVEFIEGGTECERHAALSRAVGAWAASGTATLELALLGRPHLIFYRVHPITFALGRRLIRTRYIGLPNLVAGASVLPELLQDGFRPEPLVAFARRLLSDDPFRARLASGLERVRRGLPGPGASVRAARATLQVSGRLAEGQRPASFDEIGATSIHRARPSNRLCP